MKDIQDNINEVFESVFGYTPQTERLEDIQKQFFKLMRNTGVRNLKASTADLLTTLIQLATESGWSLEELVEQNLTKIQKRAAQYKSLGRKKRIAIYGGAFNPITNGHIQVAQFVLNVSGHFDEVWIMPAYQHMNNKRMESAEHRIKMCELAAAVDGRIKVFDYEIKHQLAGETFKMVKQLTNDEAYTGFDFAFIMGLDNANSFDKWVNYEHLEKMMKFVIVPRKGIERDLSKDWYLKAPHIFLNNENTAIQEVSSTLIRNILSSGEELERLAQYMNKEVVDYIASQQLYTS
ncbi:MAG: nicotinate (nicotinamide) nucleotide adenylyltransferase [Aureispira sp.]|nr:nicotinate (nicotinamide) nucleotide adenylyltransferase [Aureispira sp.]